MTAIRLKPTGTGIPNGQGNAGQGVLKDTDITARMLYDHEKDPMENTNIAGLPEHRELIARLRKMLHDGWRAALP